MEIACRERDTRKVQQLEAYRRNVGETEDGSTPAIERGGGGRGGGEEGFLWGNLISQLMLWFRNGMQPGASE